MTFQLLLNLDKTPMQVLAGVVAILLLLVLVILVRKNRLKTSYSLLWFAAWFVCSFFIIFINLLDKIAFFLNVGYSPTLLLMMSVAFLAMIILHLTVVITRQSKQINALAQDMAILKEGKEGQACED